MTDGCALHLNLTPADAARQLRPTGVSSTPMVNGWRIAADAIGNAMQWLKAGKRQISNDLTQAVVTLDWAGPGLADGVTQCRLN